MKRLARAKERLVAGPELRPEGEWPVEAVPQVEGGKRLFPDNGGKGL